MYILAVRSLFFRVVNSIISINPHNYINNILFQTLTMYKDILMLSFYMNDETYLFLVYRGVFLFKNTFCSQFPSMYGTPVHGGLEVLILVVWNQMCSIHRSRVQGSFQREYCCTTGVLWICRHLNAHGITRTLIDSAHRKLILSSSAN